MKVRKLKRSQLYLGQEEKSVRDRREDTGRSSVGSLKTVLSFSLLRAGNGKEWESRNMQPL